MSETNGSAWIGSRFDAPPDEDLAGAIDALLYSWDDDELPLVELQVGVGARTRKSVSAQQAAEDVEGLFYLFAHGYSGYGFFNQSEHARSLTELFLSSNSKCAVKMVMDVGIV